MLQLTQLVGFGVGRPPALSVSYTDTDSVNSALSTYTFTSKSIGTADPKRTVFVGIVEVGAPNTAPSSATIGGISAAAVVTAQNGTGGLATIWAAAAPTGTTATIVVNFPGVTNRCGIVVWSVYGDHQVNATATSTSDPSTASIDVRAGGVLLASACGSTSATASSTGSTVMTERVDAAIGGTTARHYGYDYSAGGADVAASVGITRSASTAGIDAAAFASLAPV